MGLIWQVITLVLYGGAFVLYSLHFAHMMQLSSYQPPGYFRWLGRQKTTEAAKMVPVLLFLLWSFVPAWYGPPAGLCFLLHAFLCTRRKAKKPLKFTPRLLRQQAFVLFFLFCVISMVTFNPEINESPVLSLTVLTVAYLLLPLWLPFAALCNAPIQEIINGRFIRDAQQTLSSARDLVVIGITGSYGKTSAKHFVTRLLSLKYNTLMTPESYNTPMGVVKTIREQLTPTTEIFVCEMGARHKGDIKELCDIVSPRFGMVTSIGPQHLETFGSVERVTETKFELIDALPPLGAAFLNGNCPEIRNRAVSRPAIYYGLGEDSHLHYRAVDLRVDSRGTTFTVILPGNDQVTLQTQLLGRHNVENLVGAVAVAHKLGVDLAPMQAGVRQMPPVPPRLPLRPGRGTGLHIIDDSFNANPAGAQAALETLALFDGLKILITPGFVEMGAEQARRHYELGQQAAAVCDVILLVGKVQTEDIAKGALQAGFPEGNLVVAGSFPEAMQLAAQWDAAGRERYVLIENDLPDQY